MDLKRESLVRNLDFTLGQWQDTCGPYAPFLLVAS